MPTLRFSNRTKPIMKFRIILLTIGFLSVWTMPHCFGQSVFVVSVKGGRSFSRVEVNDKYLGTIDEGEHLVGNLIQGTNRVRIEQRGYEAIEHVFENGGGDLVVEIRATDRVIRVTTQSTDSRKYAHFQGAGTQVEADPLGTKLTSGTLPESNATIMIHYNESDAPCSNAPYVANQITACFMKDYQLVDRRLVETVIEEQRLSLSGLVSQQTLIEAGEITGAAFVLNASINCRGPEKVNVQLNLIDCQTSEIRWVGSMRNSGVDQIFSALSELVGKP